jgi:non-ribosomal peptide synthetase component F
MFSGWKLDCVAVLHSQSNMCKSSQIYPAYSHHPRLSSHPSNHLQKTPTNFDASIDELWTSLTAGAPLVVAPPEAHRDVHSVMMLITR